MQSLEIWQGDVSNDLPTLLTGAWKNQLADLKDMVRQTVGDNS